MMMMMMMMMIYTESISQLISQSIIIKQGRSGNAEVNKLR